MSEQARETLAETALRAGLVIACLGFLLVLVGADPLAGLAALAGRSGPAQWGRDIAIGVALAAAGASLALVGGGRRVGGGLVAAVGFAWLAGVVARSVDGSEMIRGPAQALSLLVTPALLGAIVALTPRRQGGGPTVVASAMLIGAAVLVAGLRVATYDPFADPTCLRCGHGAAPLLAATVEQRALLNLGGMVLAATCAASVLAILVGRLAGGTSGGRRAGVEMVALATGSIVVALAILAGDLLRLSSTAFPLASATGDGILEPAAAIGAALLVVGLVMQTVEVLRVRFRLRQLARDVASATELGRLDARLASSLGGRPVVVGYWHEGEAGWVTASGSPVEDRSVEAAHGRVTIERGGRPVATVWHGRDLEPRAIRKEFTPSFLVALDNERLQAVGMTNVRLLQASRARLVSTQEAERRKVERDLHDGLQQRLLAIVFELRLARAVAERGGAGPWTRWLERAEVVALAIVDEVRTLARGIFPAILGQAGLSAALSSLADEAPIPVAVVVGPMARLPQEAEVTVYQAVADALADAVRGGATELSVTVSRTAHDVSVVIDHDGTTALVQVRLLDRIAAVGGSLVDDVSADLRGRRLRIALPCA